MKHIIAYFKNIPRNTKMLLWFVIGMENLVMSIIGVALDEPNLMWFIYVMFVVALVFLLLTVREANHPYYERKSS